MEKSKSNRAKFWTVAGIVISWATFWMFLFSPFGLMAWIGILIYLIVKKSRLVWYVVLSAWLFVPGCNFVTGTINYFSGKAALKGLGGPDIYHGIDPDTRAVSTSSGCIPIGYEAFAFPGNNVAVRLWTNLFGFQRGAYTGVFPSEKEATTIISSSDTIGVKKSENYLQFMSSGVNVKVDTTDFYRYHGASLLFDTVRGKVVNNECFVFEPINDQGYYRRNIYLVDIANKKLLNKYVNHN